MLKAFSVLTCVLAFADASQTFPREHRTRQNLSFSNRGSAELKHVRRDGPYTNTTIFNSSISSSATTDFILSTAPSTPPAITPIYLASNATYQNTSAATTTSQESCLGSVTYLDSVPPTVYATTTESVLVTVSASNASLPPPQFITPPVACTATVIPAIVSEISEAPLFSLQPSSINSACPFGNCFPGTPSPIGSTAALSFQPALTVITVSFAPAATVAPQSSLEPENASTAAPLASQLPVPSTGSAFTSTVLVTKKTTIPVVVPPTSAPPVFQIPATTKKPTTTPKVSAAGGSPSVNPNAGNPSPAGQSPTTTQVGNIIASVINNPFTPISSNGGKVPATTTIDNVPVQILPSSVVIGGQVLSIPGTSSKTTLQVNGQTFTVQNSQIIAPGTTYAITAARNQESPVTAAPSPVTAGGLTFSVGASQAIISGTTYAIGNGAGSSTTIRIGGSTVVIGSGGVILPSTTVAPVMITAPPLAPEVVTAAGLTFTVGPSFAIISGSTYTIGPGAKPTTIVVGGKTISVGSNGIGLASTTIAPEPNYSVITLGGLTFSVDSTEAILRGTTYKIGKGAPTETTKVGGKTLSLGPGGVGLQSTTIPPETGPTATGGANLFLISHFCALLALLVGAGAFFL